MLSHYLDNTCKAGNRAGALAQWPQFTAITIIICVFYHATQVETNLRPGVQQLLLCIMCCLIALRHQIGPKTVQIWCLMVSFLNHIVSIL